MMRNSEANYFSYLLFSGVSSDLFRILFFWWIVSEYGGESLSSILTISTILSFILLQILSPIADLKSKRIILTLSCFLFSGSFFFVAASSTIEELSIYIASIAFLCVSSISTIFRPAQSAIITDVASNDRVSLLIRRNKLVTSSIAILGPLIAGYIGTISITLGFMIAGGLMLLCVFFSYNLPDTGSSSKKGIKKEWRKSIAAGWEVKKKARVEFWYTVITAITNTLVTPFFMILIPLTIKDKFSGDSFAYGAAEASVAIGSLFAAALLLPVLNKYLEKLWICSVGVMIAGFGILVSSLSDHLIIFTLFIPFVGAGIAVFTMNGMSHRILAFPKEKRARISAIDLSIGQLTRVIGIGVTGLLITFFEVGTIGLIYGVLIMALSFLLLVIPDWREFMSLNHDQLEGYFERKYSI